MSRSRMSAINRITIVLIAVFIWPSPSVRLHERGHDVQFADRVRLGERAEHTLTCGPGRTIGDAIRRLKPGDTLLVSGTCHENVQIGEEVHRITLDGQGTASINGDSSANAVTVKGTGITIRGFVITGGAPQGIAVTDGASALIDGNTIQYADRNGITVFRNSSADIVNNTIQYSGLAGIAIQNTSSARVGWFGPPNNRVSAPNTIQNNGAQGVQVYRGSSAQIFTNTIQHNGSHGVIVDRNAQAEIAACTIAGNAGDGIRGIRNAGVDIGTDATGATPSSTTIPTPGRTGDSASAA